MGVMPGFEDFARRAAEAREAERKELEAALEAAKAALEKENS